LRVYRNILMLGLLKLNEAENRLAKSMSDIEALLLRLPVALAAVLANLNSRTQKEMENALAKALNVIKRVEGTKTVEIIDGKRVEKGVYSLVGILTRLIES